MNVFNWKSFTSSFFCQLQITEKKFIFPNIKISKTSRAMRTLVLEQKQSFTLKSPLDIKNFEKLLRKKWGTFSRVGKCILTRQKKKNSKKGQNKYSINLIYSPDINVFVLCVTSFSTASVLYFFSSLSTSPLMIYAGRLVWCHRQGSLLLILVLL